MHDWTTDHNQPVSEFVFFYLMPFGIYWVGWQMRITERGLKTMFVLLGIFGVYLAATAIAEKCDVAYGSGVLVFPRYIMEPSRRSSWAEAAGRC